MHHPSRIVRAALGAGAILAIAAPAAVAAPTKLTGVVVCNEAQSSWKGTWDATGSTDPLPPARHKDKAMPVGTSDNAGLINAAAHSPALAVCQPAPPPPGDGGGGDGNT